MTEVTEIFVLKMKDAGRANDIREKAREDFLSVEGVDSWKTYVTINPDRPTLFAEIYTFADEKIAKKVTPQFAKRELTKAFLGEIEEILVGQYFTEHQPLTGENK
ncbi:hypothetical protein Patl_1515 [Paraglaciecola sp. T6c]|uniref:hypothetical protein n=1 Tax=Pseudoalteromonas atlantica (strain T6c / ATCC BAA-1087) TaxID=3042615 RepID=UPI00005C67B0|nr:hypothetical protein [Paraglaciecola sp. T6c]ABG40037.1 hypothetical protein Patl_1515 [Paraglaciecola sp. T6c]